MKKWLAIVVITLLLLVATSIAVLWWLPVEQKTRLVNAFLEPYQLSVERVDYTPPYKLQVEGLSSEKNDLYLPSATVWLNPGIIYDNQIIIDSVLIEGVQLNDQQHLRSLPVFNSTFLEHIKFHQLALQHVDMELDGWILRDASIQIASPRWLSTEQRLPYGDIQFKAEQVYIEGEALDDALLNVVHQPEKSTVYGASFNWNGAKFSGQAELINDFWSLINVTIGQLDIGLEEQQINELHTELLDRFKVNHINSLDLINSQISTEIWQVENLNLSIEEIQLDREIWQQDRGYFSFDADSISYGDFSFIAPKAKVNLAPNQLEIEEWDSDLWQGRLQVSGLWTPASLKLKKLHMSGVKLLDDTLQQLQEMRNKSNLFREITIDDLIIARSQILQVESEPFWQASGVNAKGAQLIVKRAEQWGLWQGELELSINSASYDDIITTQGIIETHVDKNEWRLNRLFIPLEHGYVDATGVRQLSGDSLPWQLDFTVDSLPIDTFNQFDWLPFELSGLLDMQGDLKGLSKTNEILRYSMDGHIDIGMREAALVHHTEKDGNSQTTIQPFEMSGLYSTFNRGVVKFATKRLVGTHSKGDFSGEYDWVDPKDEPLWIQFNGECEQWWVDVLSGETREVSGCDEEILE
ncbi:AsmA family protein [Vibrio astriarenae]|uniref:AsmA family protein n=1 Tax=Vibrio astriarenae TaxID=1481923 RepID=A0A7Z2T5G8_9VIBR|nr:AsmA family protein [Vibrio astriarenae]QIA64508.1 AsmA family protein [Vibrio astriarenae]